MGVLFIFILISALVISALLFFNKGEKAQEIKSILKDIYENIKELTSNLKKLFLILKELIQSKLGTELSQSEGVSASEQLETLSTESKGTTTDPKTDGIAEQGLLSDDAVEAPSVDSTPNSIDSTPTKKTSTEIISSELVSNGESSNDNDLDKSN